MIEDMSSTTQPLKEEITYWYLSKLLLVSLQITRKVKIAPVSFSSRSMSCGNKKKKKELYLFQIQFSAFVFSTLLNVKDPFPFRLNFLLRTQETCDSWGAR